MDVPSSRHDNALKNDLSETLSLAGLWDITLGRNPEQTIMAPSAWETNVRDWTTEGPAIYRKNFTLPNAWFGHKVVLEAHAISFASVVQINGVVAGEHKGMWSTFQLDVTPLLQLGENQIKIEVWKPGTRYPIRQAMAGFLPDVASTFGGIWQKILLRKVDDIAVYDLLIQCRGNGTVTVDGALVMTESDLALIGACTVSDGSRIVGSASIAFMESKGERRFHCHILIPDIALWSIGQKTDLYIIDIRINTILGKPAIQLRRTVGFRDIIAEGRTLLFNAKPTSLRGVLDWGWDPVRLCPTPEREEVIAQINKARSLGFNLLKLCLFVPNDTTFEVADEYGMPIWLELPMWLPDVTPEMYELALREYDAILCRLHHHPSILIVSLGCELQHNVSAEVLTELSGVVSKWFPNVLRCDNSGSAEAYGGVHTTISDFYDYHFYTDPHHFQSLVDHFDRSYQPPKPWIYGEFCDADTARDFSDLDASLWWLHEPVTLDREELRWTREYAKRLSLANIDDGCVRLTHIARLQATAIRKYIFEQVRSQNATGGYVITGWTDTPISTSGLIDDRGDLKFDPTEWQQFNSDSVLILDRERRRYWTGGDRPLHADPYCFWQSEPPEFHLALSHGDSDAQLTSIGVEISDNKRRLPLIFTPIRIGGGGIKEIAIFGMPHPLQSTEPIELTIDAQVSLQCNGANKVITNTWRLIAVPGKDKCLLQIQNADIHFTLTPDLIDRVRGGCCACLWLQDPESALVAAMPFWREAIHDFSPHPFWSAIPNPGFADMRFFSVATDIAIQTETLRAALGDDAIITPIWRRFDARRLTYSDYLAEVNMGTGRLYISTLRFAGGTGHQPDRLSDNPMGALMLKTLLDLCVTSQCLHP